MISYVYRHTLYLQEKIEGSTGLKPDSVDCTHEYKINFLSELTDVERDALDEFMMGDGMMYMRMDKI